MSDPATNGEADAKRMADLVRLEKLVANVVTLRQQLFQQMLDPRRDINVECGYPEEVTVQQYHELYRREPIARRVVQVMPRQSWQVQPSVFEDKSSRKVTPFEEAWDGLSRSLRGKSWYQDEKGSIIWSYLRRADELSGIGRFGIILLGVDDGKPLSEPVDGVAESVSQGASYSTTGQGTDAQYFSQYGTEFTGSAPVKKTGKKAKRKLTFLRVFSEHLVQVTQYESNPANPRFCQPIMYLVTLNDPRDQQGGVGLSTGTVMVHWTRVIHIADNLESSEAFATPRMEPVLNCLLDIRKIRGSSAEGFWKSCFTGLSIETHPQLGGDVGIDKGKTRDMLEEYQNGLQRYLVLMGMSAKSLAPSVVDPTGQIAVQIEAICIEKAIPVRIFKGSERGELASTQDDGDWNDKVQQRENDYNTPCIIAPLVDRLVMIGVLPEPDGYSTEWPDLSSLTALDKANIAVQKTTALSAYVQGGGEALVPPLNFLGWLDMDEEEAAAALEDAAKAEEEKQQEQQSLADEHGMVPAPPPGFAHPPPPAPAPAPVKVKPGEKLVQPPAGKPLGNVDSEQPAEPAVPEPVRKPVPTEGSATKSRVDNADKTDAETYAEMTRVAEKRL